MAHEIEGNKAFYTVTPAWHGLGTVLSEAPSIEEAWKLAYPHTLFKMDLEATLTDDDGIKHTMPLQHSKVIMRDDGVEMRTVSDSFELVQPIEILEQFRPLLESGHVKLEAGGSLKNGSIMWALGKIDRAETEIVKGDHIGRYVLFYTGFDGTLSAGTGITDVRTVCMNTLRSAIQAGISYKFKHTKNIRARMDSASQVIQKTIADFHKDIEQYRYLASKQWDKRKMQAYVGHVLLTDEEFKGDKEISSKKQTIVNNVLDLLDTQKGLELVPSIRGTAWQAYNAITEYTTHEYGRSQDSRIHAQWFGESAKLNNRAMELALTM